MPWLRTGTVACTLNSTTVTGTGTGFVANARVGDAFLGPDGGWYEVANIASDTALSILPAYLGATISAGSYALAPMQGYVKDSADQLRTLVNKFGTLAAAASINALAGQTGAADKIAYFTAADQMALASFPAQARTLLAATTQAAQRNALSAVTQGSGINMSANTVYIGWSGSNLLAQVDSTQLGALFYRTNILGTVGQSGGVPTGAVLEWGSNSNGLYIRLADGTQICHKRVGVDSATLQVGSALFGTNAYGGGAYPAAFAATPTVNGQAQYYVNGSVGYWASSYNQPTISSWGDWRAVSAASLSSGGAINLIAIGRWY